MLRVNNFLILERLREERGFKSQERFVDGICNPRQYRRYIYGEATMPTKITIALISRLNMTIKEVYTYYLKLSNEDQKEVQKIYNKLMSGNYNGLGKEIENLKNITFIEKPDQTLYLFCKYFFDFKNSRINKPLYIEQVKSLISYNDILHYEVITLYEMLILSNLIKDVSESDQVQIVKLLTKTIRSTNVDDISSIDYYLVIIYSLAKYYGLKEDYSNAFEMCDKGINLSKKYHHYYLLAQLYYFKAIFYKSLNIPNEMDENIHLCISVLEVSVNSGLSIKIKALLEKDFKINIINFEKNYWTNKKKTTSI